MTRLREPISPIQVVAVLVGVALGVAGTQGLGGKSSPLTWLLVAVVAELVVQPVSTLVHELGHAGAVAMLGRRPAFVVVGRGPWATIRLGSVTARFSPLPTRGVRIGGVCRYDPGDLPWRSLGWIALAGPIATLLELVLVVALAPLLWNAGVTVRWLIVISALGLLGSLVINLFPRRMTRQGESAIVGQRDGWQAWQAFKRHRENSPPPPAQGIAAAVANDPDSDLPPHWAPSDPEQRRVFEDELRRALRPPAPGEDPAERRRLEAQLRAALTPPEQAFRQLSEIEQQRDLARKKTSVPPPGHGDSSSGEPA